MRALAEMTGLERNTVRRVLLEEAPCPAQRRGRGSCLDPYKPYLEYRYAECALTAMRLLDSRCRSILYLKY
jgi:DNA-binding transcriptional regulator YhcF (GntR family)